jgi:hypothetical protein
MDRSGLTEKPRRAKSACSPARETPGHETKATGKRLMRETIAMGRCDGQGGQVHAAESPELAAQAPVYDKYMNKALA